ncbi:STAS domain-containing protein [Micromonospora sonneratiae]|uniref:Anti-sigma factor antagonist n=1 Tax=Micromonospora sonneratiae TaxID=1184706 RepID=A0ABW3YA81_9ACTN
MHDGVEAVMTVVPGRQGAAVHMICDGCGVVVTGAAGSVRDDVVWPLTTAHGWSGSPFAIGPHRCPRCATTRRHAPVDGTRHPEPRHRCDVGIEYERFAAVVRLVGDVDLLVADELRQLLTVALSVRQLVVLDLARVSLIDSTGLGVLVRAHRDAKQCGGTLCLAAPSRFIRTVLHTMRLESVFPIFENSEHALASLA